MTYTTTTISKLVRWDGNPRPPASETARAELKATIIDKGLIVPLIVRHKSGPKNGAKRVDEVIGGDTRRAIIAELVAEGQWEADRPIDVIVRDDLVGDDAAALDVALSNNIHIPMHAMDQFHAFNQMVEMGRDVKQIANAYGVSARVVEQRLSYAKLDDRARQMVKSDERDLEWAAAMTVASPQEQAQMLDEIEVDPRRYLTVHDVRRRLEDDLVSTEAALFDTSSLGDSLVRRDLFDDSGASYMKRSEFQPLQDQALDKLAEERRAEGWSRVTTVSERDFDRYKYEDGVADKNRAEVVFVRHPSGAVSEHAGLALRAEERINAISNEDEAAGSALFSETAEIARAVATRDPRVDEGKKTQRYVSVSKGAIIQAILLEDAKLATAVLVAGLISNSAPRPLEGRIATELTEIDADNPSRRIIERRIDAARQIMDAGGIDVSMPYGDLIDRLVALGDDQLSTLLQVQIAKRVSGEMSRIDMMFDGVFGREGRLLQNYWRPDRTYLGTLSKEAVEQVARQTLPPRVLGKITGSKSDMVEALAQILDDAHEDGGRLGAQERQIATAWAPASLSGGRDAGVFDHLGDDDSGNALFGESGDELVEA